MVVPRKRGEAIDRFQNCHFMRSADLSVPSRCTFSDFGVKSGKNTTEKNE